MKYINTLLLAIIVFSAGWAGARYGTIECNTLIVKHEVIVEKQNQKVKPKQIDESRLQIGDLIYSYKEKILCRYFDNGPITGPNFEILYPPERSNEAFYASDKIEDWSPCIINNDIPQTLLDKINE